MEKELFSLLLPLFMVMLRKHNYLGQSVAVIVLWIIICIISFVVSIGISNILRIGQNLLYVRT